MGYSEVEQAVSKLMEQADFDQVDFGDEESQPGGYAPGEDVDWGSCQYSTAAGIYSMLMAKQEELGSVEATIEWFADVDEGADLSGYRGVRSVEEAWMDFRDAMNDHFDVDYFGYGAPGAEATVEQQEEWQERQDQLDALPHTYGDMFRFLRDSSWDLWSAAPFVGNMALDYDGFLPDEDTGALCWLLKASGAVQDEEVFSGFDT